MTYESEFFDLPNGGKSSIRQLFLERKRMSTKTTFKRVALVAAAALTFAGISGVAAHATGTTTDSWNVSSAYTGTSTFSAGASTAGTQVVGGVATLQFQAVETSTAFTFATSGVGTISNASNGAGWGTPYFVGGTTAATFPTTTIQSTTTSENSTGNISLSVVSSVAGTQTLTATQLNSSGVPVASYTATVTWVAATAGVSAQYTTSGMASGAGSVTQGTNATVAYTDAAQSTAASRAASIVVAPHDANNTPLNTEKLTVVISGPGTLAIDNSFSTNATGRALTGAAGAYDIAVFADGTSGVSTVTISDGTTTLATKTITFYGAPAKATVTQNLYIVKAGAVNGQAGNDKALTGTTVSGAAGTGVALSSGTAGTGTASFTAAVVDSNGNASAGATVKAVSSNTAVIASAACTEETTDAPGTFQCQVTGASGAASGSTATVTFEVYDAATAAYDILATPITFTIGGAPATVALSTDASSYSIGAPVTVTLTVKDSAGNAAYDADYANLLGGTLSSTLALSQGTLPGAIESVINGVATTKVYSPVIPGTATISGTTGASSANSGAAISATFAVTGDTSAADNASLATDAANAATDAANAAAASADNATQAASDALAAVQSLTAKVSSLFASLQKQITALTKLLKK
jgi:trimeric autotransporter adhesin